jgi:F0F1-type ATP synthase delta subunit
VNTPASVLAEAFLESIKDIPEADHAHAADAAIRVAAKQGIALGDFQREVQRLLPRYDRTVHAVLETTDGKAGAHAHALQKELAGNLDRPVTLEERKADVLGGAVLRVGDDRFDFSVRGALQHAEDVLKGTSFAS